MNIPTDDIQAALEQARTEVPKRKVISKACQLLKAQFPKEDIYPHKLRYHVSKLGNETADDMERVKESAQRRNFQVENNRLRRELRTLLDDRNFYEELNAQLVEAVASLPPVNLPEVDVPEVGTKSMTAEYLLSDLQMGKKMQGYNSDIAEDRLKEYGEVLFKESLKRMSAGYKLDKIILAVLGDMIESDRKHKNSARGCDSSTPEQIVRATRAIYQHVILPLSHLGVPLRVICCTGNHDHDDLGMEMVYPGRNQLSFPIYSTWKLLAEAHGLEHVEVVIPPGPFHVEDIYGQKALYEHGYGCSISEKSLQDRRAQRSVQVREHLTYFRMGDKHNASRFACDSLVVNGAFFGDDTKGSDYNSIAGFDNRPWQLAFFHVPREDRFRTTLYDSFAVQLGHIR